MGINGYALLTNGWRVCGGVPNVGSGVVMHMITDSTATTEALHNEARSPREALGYVGYCHLGTARVWSSSYEGCNTEAIEFMQQAPRYMTRKGLFIYKLILGKEKKFIKRIQNVEKV